MSTYVSGYVCNTCGRWANAYEAHNCHAVFTGGIFWPVSPEKKMEKIKLSESEKAELKNIRDRMKEEFEENGSAFSNSFIYDMGYLNGLIDRLTE